MEDRFLTQADIDQILKKRSILRAQSQQGAAHIELHKKLSNARIFEFNKHAFVKGERYKIEYRWFGLGEIGYSFIMYSTKKGYYLSMSDKEIFEIMSCDEYIVLLNNIVAQRIKAKAAR